MSIFNLLGPSKYFPLMHATLTTPVTRKKNLDKQTPSLETTPLLQHTHSFHPDVPTNGGISPSSAGRTVAYTSLPSFAFVSANPRPLDELINSNLRQPRQAQAHLDPKLALALDFQSISLSLENVGGVARDHLASERTFLAYLRTSLSIASAGVALAQILSLTEKLSSEEESYSRLLGGAAVLFSIIVLGVGVYRYFSIQRALVEGIFPASRVGVVFLALLLGILITVTIGVLFVDGREVR
ncbi:hypothetical protein BDZ94DRAFT_917692 [Collybia nuda]|uniref:DUF202 domain-containing protein n=1 Tax=Collybia nuda TaxID=64659 RepID=A0A9P5YHX6_9AGAR|nr:hypothetical protein BDZ94DRAFT_917692 [Collybia nuda]